MKVRHYACWILGGVSMLALGLFTLLSEEVAPLEDRSTLNITATAPERSTFFYMDRVMDEITDVTLEEVPETDILNTITSQTSTNSGTAFLNLVKPQDRSRSQQEIAIRSEERRVGKEGRTQR